MSAKLYFECGAASRWHACQLTQTIDIGHLSADFCASATPSEWNASYAVVSLPLVQNIRQAMTWLPHHLSSLFLSAGKPEEYGRSEHRQLRQRSQQTPLASRFTDIGCSSQNLAAELLGPLIGACQGERHTTRF